MVQSLHFEKEKQNWLHCIMTLSSAQAHRGFSVWEKYAEQSEYRHKKWRNLLSFAPVLALPSRFPQRMPYGISVEERGIMTCNYPTLVTLVINMPTLTNNEEGGSCGFHSWCIKCHSLGH